MLPLNNGLRGYNFTDNSKYEILTEEEILEILQEKILSKEEFQCLLEKVKLLDLK